MVDKTNTYSDITLNWRPGGRSDFSFGFIVALVVGVLLAAGLYISSIDLPKEKRRLVTPVPDRIAQFIEQKPKPLSKPKPIPKPKPKPIVKTEPKPEPAVKIERKPKKKIDKKLTDTEKEARKKAEKSGLLALTNELSDLFDTSEVSAQVSATIKQAKPGDAAESARIDREKLTAEAGRGSEGIDASQYGIAAEAASAGLATKPTRKRQIIRQDLVAEDEDEKLTKKQTQTVSTKRSDVRSEEDVAIVFDKNKGRLYSLYNRARRTKPSLRGKIIIELTIDANGNVAKASIVSSELNDSALEARLLSRIKLFKFGAKNVKPITVTFPIEFLPS